MKLTRTTMMMNNERLPFGSLFHCRNSSISTTISLIFTSSALLAIMTLCAGVAACGSSESNSSDGSVSATDSTTQETAAEVTTSVADTLNTSERSIFEALIAYSTSLPPPSSLRIAEIKTGGSKQFIRINGENGFGGAGEFWLAYEYDMDLKKGKITVAEDFMINAAQNLSSGSWDINKLNRALAEYFNY